MNSRWLLVRRLRGPAYLVTFGVTALLHQWGVLSFGRSWPLYLIVAGVLVLLERAAFTDASADAGYGSGSYGVAGQPYAPQGSSQPPAGSPSSSIVPSSEIPPERRS